MSRKPRVQRTPEEKWQIVLEGLKSGNVAETCRKYEIAPNLYYRWKDEVEAGAKAAICVDDRHRSVTDTNFGSPAVVPLHTDAIRFIV